MTVNVRHLPNAPITEAIIEFGVIPQDSVELSALKALADSLSEYGEFKPLYQVSSTIRFETPDNKPEAEVSPRVHVGYRSDPDESRKLVTITPDSLLFHKLRPYTSWGDIFPEALSIFKKYTDTDALAPVAIRKLAARYINHIELERGSELDDYLRFPPEHGKDFGLSGYLKRAQLQDNRTKLFVNKTEIVEGPRAPGTHGVIVLDNDVYATEDLPDRVDDLDAIKTVFNRIQKLKNRVFFSSLTDEALGKFQ